MPVRGQSRDGDEVVVSSVVDVEDVGAVGAVGTVVRIVVVVVEPAVGAVPCALLSDIKTQMQNKSSTFFILNSQLFTLNWAVDFKSFSIYYKFLSACYHSISVAKLSDNHMAKLKILYVIS